MNLKYLNLYSRFLLPLCLFIFLLAYQSSALAAVVTWDGGAGNNDWGAPQNWSDDTSPGSDDVATFDGTSTVNATMDINVNVKGIDINTGYTGTITQPSDKTLTLGVTGFAQDVGGFTSSGNITNTGAITITGGTFTHNGGLFKAMGSSRTYNVNSTITFNQFTVEMNNGQNLTIASNDTIIVSNALILKEGKAISSTIEARGNVTVETTYDTGNSSFLKFTQGAAQTFTLNAIDRFDANITIDKTANSVQLLTDLTMDNGGQDLVIVAGTLDLNAKALIVNDDISITGTLSGGVNVDAKDIIINDNGTLTAPTGLFTVKTWSNTGTGVFNEGLGTVTIDDSAGTFDVNSNETFNNLIIAKNTGQTLTLATSDKLTVTGILTYKDGLVSSGDSIEAQGNVDVEIDFDGGSTKLVFAGSATQNFNLLTGATDGFNANIEVNKSGGSVQLASALIMDNGGQDLIILSGNFDSNGQNININDELNVTGTFTGSGGYVDVADVIINTNGTLIAPSGAFNTKTWSNTGTGTFTEGTNTVTFDRNAGNIDVNGNDTFYNVIIDKTDGQSVNIGSGDIIKVSNNLILRDGQVNSGNYLEAQGDVTIEADYDGGGTKLVFKGSATVQDFDLTGAIDKYKAIVEVDKSSGQVRLLSDFSLIQGGTDLIIVAGDFNSNTKNVSIADDLSITGTFIGTSGTLTVTDTIINSNGTLTAPSGTYKTKSFTNTGTGTFTEGTNTVTIDSGAATINVNSSEIFYNLILDKNDGAATTIASGDSLFISNLLTLRDGQVNTGNLKPQGNVVIETDFDGGASPLIFDGGAVQTISAIGAEALYNGNIQVNKSGGNVTALSNLTLDASGQDFIMTAGTFNLSNRTLVVADNFDMDGGVFNGQTGNSDLFDMIIDGGTFNASSGNTTISKQFTNNSGDSSYVAGVGTTIFDGGSATMNPVTSQAFNNVTVNMNDDIALTINNGETMVVNGVLNLIEGKVLTGTIECKGDVSVSAGFAASSSPFKFSGNASQNLSVNVGAIAVLDGDFTVDKSGGSLNLINAVTLNAANQDITIAEGTFDTSGNNFTVNGSSGKVVVQNGGNFQLQGGETLTFNASNPTLDVGSTVTYDGGASYTVNDWAYQTLVTAGSGIFSLAAAETIVNLTLNSGTFAAAGNALTVSGTFSNNANLKLFGSETTDITMDTDSGRVIYAGDGDGVSETFTIKEKGADDYFNLDIADENATKDTFNVAADLNVTGLLTIVNGTMTHGTNTVDALDLNISGGTFTGGSATIDVGEFIQTNGIFTSTSGTFNVSKDFTHTGGTFTHNSGTVFLDGTTQELFGSTTFNHFTKAVTAVNTLTFPAGEGVSTTINGTTTLKGESGKLLAIRSSTDGVQANVNYVGAREAEYLDVKDNKQTGTGNYPCVLGCINNNNNTKWLFIGNYTVNLSVANSPLAEDGGVATVTATVSEALNQNVTVNLGIAGSAINTTDYSLSTNSITINKGATTGSITITGIDDTTDEDNETVTANITTVVNATENGNQQITANITDDDDPPTVTLSVNNASIAEDASNSVLTATLSAASSKNVTVNLGFSGSAANVADYTRTTTNITINAGATTGTSTIASVVDGLDEENETVIMDVNSVVNGTENGSQQKIVTITDDDDAPTVQFTTVSQNKSENSGAVNIAAQLSTASGRNVTVPFTINGSSAATLTDDYTKGASPVTIFAGNTSVNVVITVVDDNDDEDAETVVVNMGNPTNATQGVKTVHTLTIDDNDLSGFTIAETNNTTVTEGGLTDTYTVVLDSKPTNSVTINNSPDSQTTIDKSSLTFTTGNWDTAQTITVTAVDDNAIEGAHTSAIGHVVASSDSKYDTLNQNLTANVVDNDTAGVTITEVNGAVEEGGSAVYKVSLTSPPTDDVVISLTSGAQLSTNLSSLTFTADNWNAKQGITVTAVDDSVAESTHTAAVSYSAISDDANYNQIVIGNTNVTISDNDSAGATFINNSSGTAITTLGTSNNFSLVLTSKPTKDVSLTVSSAEQINFEPGAVTFTASNWDTEQTVVATFIEGKQPSGDSATISVKSVSNDLLYNAITITPLTVSLVDDGDNGDTEIADDADCRNAKVFEGDNYVLGSSCIHVGDSSSLDYEWTQISGLTVTLSDSLSLTTSFTMPTGNTVPLVFSLTVHEDGLEIFSDLLSIFPIKKAVTLDDDEDSSNSGTGSGGIAVEKTEDKKVIVKKYGRIIQQSKEANSDNYYSLLLGNSVEVLSKNKLTKDNVSITDRGIIIGAPSISNDQGLVVLISNMASGKKYYLDDPSLVSKSGILAVTEGNQSGQQFGFPIIVSNNLEDGILVFALGIGYGSAYVLDIDNQTLALKNLIIGDSSNSLSTKATYSRFDSVDTSSRAILGTNSNGVSSSQSSYLASNPPLPSRLQILDDELDTVFDFSTDPVFSTIESNNVTFIGSADIDGDGNTDLVSISQGSCAVDIYLNEANDDNELLSVENTLLCSDSSEITSLQLGDVDGDGIADILIGVEGSQKIYAILGGDHLASETSIEENSIAIAGESGIGGWIVIGDDGVIYTSDGSGGSIAFSLTGEAILDGSGDDSGAGTGGSALGPGGAGCSLAVSNHQGTERSNQCIWFVFLLCSLLLGKVVIKAKT
jgi:hypothetical protein